MLHDNKRKVQLNEVNENGEEIIQEAKEEDAEVESILIEVKVSVEICFSFSKQLLCEENSRYICVCVCVCVCAGVGDTLCK